MSRQAYIARAAALQAAAAIKTGDHFFCEQLPPMEVGFFLAVLRDETDDASAVSLALVGYQLSDMDLREKLDSIQLDIGSVTTDLHVAAKWRNEPKDHPMIVALATGRHPGVSTLAHFSQGNPRVFALELLKWAQKSALASKPQQAAPGSTPMQGVLATTPQQKALLATLVDESLELSPLISLSGVAGFLSEWEQQQVKDELDAPRRALPRLGMLPDRNLLSETSDIADRLLKNFNLTQEIAKMSGSRLEDFRRRAKLYNPSVRSQKLTVIDRAEKIRRVGDFDAYGALDYEDAREVFKPTSGPIPSHAPRPSSRDGGEVAEDGGELLIDANDDELKALVASIRDALTEAVNGDKDSASGNYEFKKDEQQFEFEVQRELLTWVRHFCSGDAWGGFFEAPPSSFEDAIRNYSQFEPTVLEPLKESISHDGELYRIRSLIEPIQKELSSQYQTRVDLCGLWDGIASARQVVMNHLDILIHQPMLALAGQPALRAAVESLLQAWNQFYSELALHHAQMHRIDHAWTQLLFEAVAVLDVVQIKTNHAAGKTSWKAVLLPTHPLHLWRYERIAALAHGLKLEGMDRAAVLEQLRNPEHYLGVIYLTSIPGGKGGTQRLPVARDFHGLAVFENLRNAYSGSDGLVALQHCVRQFAQIYVNHARPLRLALVNPPDASSMLVALLSHSHGRRPKPSLLVDIYATPDHQSRLKSARRFSTEDRDQIEDHIASRRLQLRVNDEILPLAARLRAIRDNPVHIIAVFDEASTAMRDQPGGTNLLPMSPFAIRRRIAFQGIQRKVELLPSIEESVFRSFYDMVGKLHGADASVTPQASADAELMADQINTALMHQSPATFWFFFADRALPTPGRVSCARILERREGRRRTVCYDADYARLALMLRSPLDRFNLRFSPSELEVLLGEGVALLGDGLIDLFKADGQPDIQRVRGFAGMLIAARDYRSRYPNALLVSVDTKLARLWLRLTDSGERCDLLGLRREDSVLTVDAIEVKTTGGSFGVSGADIQKGTSQLNSTLEAIESGLEKDEHSSVLIAPRQEMLKEVFVSGCQALTASREDRTMWAEWLKSLFRENESEDVRRLRGTVYAIELSRNSPTSEQALRNDPYDVVLRCLREERIQALVSVRHSPSAVSKVSRDGGSHSQPPSPPNSPPSTEMAVDSAATPVAVPHSQTSKSSHRPALDDKGANLGIRFVVGHGLGGREQQPYYLNPSNTKLNQLNIGVVGDLGTGKTQMTKALIYQLTRQAAANRGQAPKFLIFDYKRDYTKPDFVNAVGARVVSPHRIPLNVLDIPIARTSLPAARLGRVKFLNDALQKIYGGIGPRQRNYLKTAVLRAYKSRPDDAPTLTDVLQEYSDIVGERVDSSYSILSDLVDLEILVDHSSEAVPFDEFFTGVTVIDLAALGVGTKERNMLLVLFLNLYYEYMINLVKQPYLGTDPQLRFIDSMLLVDEADNIMKYNFEVLRQILLQGREFGVGVLLASQFLSHFKTRETDYSEPLLTWCIHKVPNVTSRELQSIGLNQVSPTMVERVKSLEVHECLYKTLDVPGRFMRALPFYEFVDHSST